MSSNASLARPGEDELTRSYEAEDPVYLKGNYSGRDTIRVADLPYKPDRCKELASSTTRKKPGNRECS